jgi:hypothetical protein
VRGRLDRFRADGRRRVAGAERGADRHRREPARLELGRDAGEWRSQVLLDVVGQRLQRRNVEDAGLVAELTGEADLHQLVDRAEEGGERLARAGGRGDERVPAGLDGGPALLLRRRRLAERALEPARHGRVKELEDGAHGNSGTEL